MSQDLQYICHRKGSLAGTKRKNHKYVARVLLKKASGGKGNKYQYFYDMESYKAYLKGQKTPIESKSKNKNADNDKTSSILSKFKFTVSKKQLKDNVLKGKKSLNKVVGRTIKSIEKASDKTKAKISKETKEIYKDVKKSVKAVSKDVKKSVKEVSRDVKKSVKKLDLSKSMKEISKDVKKSKNKVDKFLSSDKLKTKLNKTTKEISKEIKMGKSKVDKILDKSSDKTEKITKALSKNIKSPEVIKKGKENVNKQINKTTSEFAIAIPAKWVDAAAKLVSDIIESAGNKIEKLVDKITNKEPDEYKHKIMLPNGEYEYFMSDDEYEDYQERLEYQKNEPDFMKDIPDISHNDVFTKFEDQEKINEVYDPWDIASSTNCGNCSAAYELRRRGYDVEAKLNDGESYNGRGDRFYDYFENAEVLCVYGDGETHVSNEEFIRKVWDDDYTDRDCRKNKKDVDFFNNEQRYSAKTIEKAIKANNPPGSRGMIDVDWKGGSGHSIIYEVNKDGSVTIRDSQTYDEYDLTELARDVARVRLCRTDNLQLKEDILNAVQPNTNKERKYYADGDYVYDYRG